MRRRCSLSPEPACELHWGKDQASRRTRQVLHLREGTERKDFGGGGRECVWPLKGTSQLRGIEAAAVDFPGEMMWHLFFVLSFNFGAGGRH